MQYLIPSVSDETRIRNVLAALFIVINLPDLDPKRNDEGWFGTQDFFWDWQLGAYAALQVLDHLASFETLKIGQHAWELEESLAKYGSRFANQSNNRAEDCYFEVTCVCLGRPHQEDWEKYGYAERYAEKHWDEILCLVDEDD